MFAPEVKQFANPDAPVLSEKRWNDMGATFLMGKREIWLVPGANCFQYAFAGSAADGSNNLIQEAEVPNPGVTGNPSRPFNLETYIRAGHKSNTKVTNLLNALVADGFELAGKGDVPPAKPGFYVVGIYLHEGHDYHFVRQDRDGGWSSKPGVDLPVERYLEPNPDGSYKKLEGRFGQGDYEFVSYVYAPMRGVNLGFETPIARYLKEHPNGEALKDYFRAGAKTEVDNIRDSLVKNHPKDIVDLFDAARKRYTPVVNPDAPVFDEAQWKHYGTGEAYASHFQYAFGGSNKDGGNNIFREQRPLPGNTAGVIPKGTPNDTALIARLTMDGIPIYNKTALPAPMAGQYLVGIYYDEKNGPMFVREDQDGGWSVQQADGKIARLQYPSGDGSRTPLPQKIGSMRLLGYSMAPRDGVNLGIEVAVAAKLDKNPDGSDLKYIFDYASPEVIAELGRALANHYDKTYVDQFEAARVKYTPPVEKKPDEQRAAR